MLCRCLALTAALLLWPSASVSAQSTGADQQSGQTDLIDLWHQIRGTPSAPRPDVGRDPVIAFAPIIGWNPTFGLSIGAAAQMVFVRGDPATTRLSSGIGSLAYSTKNQVLLNARFDVYGADDRWLLQGDNRLYFSGQDVYGLGTDTPASAAVGVNYTFVRLHETYYRRIAKDVFAGGGFLLDSHSNIEAASDAVGAFPTSPFVTYSEQHDLPLTSQQSAGGSLNLLVDKRKSQIDPPGGWMAAAAYRVSFEGFLGTDATWESLHLEFRGYVPLQAGRSQLAVWVVSDLSSNGAIPYFDLPETVGDMYGRSSRGYEEGRFRGERLVYGEVEFRTRITDNGLVGATAFVNVSTLTDLANGQQLFESAAPAAGAGLRIKVDKRSRTNLCIDFGIGKNGEHGLYFALQDAF